MRRGQRAQDVVEVGPLVVDREHALGAALGGVDDVVAAGVAQAPQHLLVERLGPGPHGELPGDVEPPSVHLVAELQGPLPLRDRRQVAEVDVGDPEALHQLGHLVGQVGGLADDVARRPHLGRRAEAAPVGAPSGPEHGHRPAPVDAEVGVLPVAVDRDEVPGRAREVAEAPDPYRERRRVVPLGPRSDHALDPAQVGPLGHPLYQLHQGAFALAADDGVDGRAGVEDGAPEGRRRLAAQDDAGVGEPLAAALRQLAGGGPLVHEHDRDPDDGRLGPDPVDDLVDGDAQPVQRADRRVDLGVAVDPLARCVDELHPVAHRAQCGGQVGQPDRWRRAVGGEALGQHHHRRTDERDVDQRRRSRRDRHRSSGDVPRGVVLLVVHAVASVGPVPPDRDGRLADLGSRRPAQPSRSKRSTAATTRSRTAAALARSTAKTCSMVTGGWSGSSSSPAS